MSKRKPITALRANQTTTAAAPRKGSRGFDVLGIEGVSPSAQGHGVAMTVVPIFLFGLFSIFTAAYSSVVLIGYLSAILRKL